MKKEFMKKTVGVSLAFTITGLLFAGCGSSSDVAAGSTDAGGTASTASSETSDGLTKVTFVSPTALESFDYLCIYAADYLGYFEEEGLEVEYVEQMGSDDCKMLAAGTAQFAYPSPGVMLSSVDAGVTDIQAILNYDSIQIFGFATNKDSGITDIAGLKETEIATPAEATAAVVSPILDRAGVNSDEVTFIAYGDSRYEAVASGATPALVTWLSEYYQLLGQGYDLGYIDGNEYAPQVSNSLCTSKTFAKEHPEIVEKFLRAFVKGMYFCYLNPEAAADITLLTCPNLEIDWDGACGAAVGDLKQIYGIEEEDMKADVDNGIGIFDMEMCQAACDNLYAAGTLSEEINAEDYYTNEYIEPIANSLDKAAVEADAESYQCSSKAYSEAQGN